MPELKPTKIDKTDTQWDVHFKDHLISVSVEDAKTESQAVKEALKVIKQLDENKERNRL